MEDQNILETKPKYTKVGMVEKLSYSTGKTFIFNPSNIEKSLVFEEWEILHQYLIDFFQKSNTKKRETAIKVYFGLATLYKNIKLEEKNKTEEIVKFSGSEATALLFIEKEFKNWKEKKEKETPGFSDNISLDYYIATKYILPLFEILSDLTIAHQEYVKQFLPESVLGK
jgi:hypothetical protein